MVKDFPEDETEEDPMPTFKRQRFEALPKGARYLWDLPESLLDYSTKYFTKHVPERDLKESVTQGNPSPDNFLEVPSLDGYYYELLEERKKNHDLAKDSAYKRIQEKLRSTMGPLCKLWYLIEELVANPDAPISKEDREEMVQYVEQTVKVIRSNLQCHNPQPQNDGTHSSRSRKQENQCDLKENPEIPEKARNELFGEDFRIVIKEKAKARKVSNSVYRAKYDHPHLQQKPVLRLIMTNGPFTRAPRVGPKTSRGGHHDMRTTTKDKMAVPEDFRIKGRNQPTSENLVSFKLSSQHNFITSFFKVVYFSPYQSWI